MYGILNQIERIAYLSIGFFSAVFTLRLLTMFVIRCIEKSINRKKQNKIDLAYVDESTLPFFSILIPARNESDVIEKTLLSISQLIYPKNKYEIVVIFDEKEKYECETTTKNKVLSFIRKNINNKEIPDILCMEVPINYDGNLDGSRLNSVVPSTKGRALNYALSHIKQKNKYHICSFFDAESHPEKNMLLKVGLKYIQYGENSVIQGPLFQVRNFWNISYFSKIISLNQAFAHEYSLPVILKFIPFLGGTNMHIPLKVMKSVSGFSSSNVTEDLDLAVRIQLKEKIRPKFIDSSSSEQTPPSFLGYFRQRQRWASGGCQVIENLHQKSKNEHDKEEIKRINYLKYKLFLYSPVEWILYFSVSFYVFITYLGKLSLAVNTFMKIFTFPPIYIWDILLTTGHNLVHGSAILCGVFVISLYLKYSPHIENAWNYKNLFRLSLLFLYVVFIAPYLIWLYTLPFIVSFFLFTFGVKERNWVRTERTVES